jgi:hypothetical protein
LANARGRRYMTGVRGHSGTLAQPSVLSPRAKLCRIRRGEMTGLARRLAIVAVVLVTVFVAVFFLSDGRNHPQVVIAPPYHVLVAKVSIPKGTGGRSIATSGLYSEKFIEPRQLAKGEFGDPSQFRGEVTTRNIPAGAQLTASEFALRGPIYYPTGYPRVVSGAQTPTRMVHYLGPKRWPHDLEVASGVWVRESPPQPTIDEFVANGTLVGFCGSVRAFQAHNPGISFATKCW